MRDVLATVRAYLATKTGITAITGTGSRLVAGTDLPPGYKPAQGSALLFNLRSGTPDYTSGMFSVSLQFRCYGKILHDENPQEGKLNAWALQSALHTAVNDTSSQPEIAYFRMDEGTFPVPLTDPATGWPYILSFYRAHVRDE